MLTGDRGDDAGAAPDARKNAERRTLRWVLVINVAQAVIVGVIGVFVGSTGLMGAALDNLADAGVYAVSLYAVGRTVVAKSRAARLSGVVLIALGIGLLGEVIRRYLAGADPVGIAMIITAAANAVVNLFCLRLLRAHRDGGVHLKASWIFASNDIVADAGIVISGAAVMLFGSPIPDLVIGLVIVAVAMKGGFEILKHAKHAQESDSEPAAAPP